MLASNMSVLAATPETSSVKVPKARLVKSTTLDTQVEVPIQGTTVTPRSIYGYAAKYTNSASGSFTVSTSGSSNSNGTLQIQTHDFTGDSDVIITLYRPDGSYATELSVPANRTKSISFKNAIPGTYTIYYSVEGIHRGWISAWVSS